MKLLTSRDPERDVEIGEPPSVEHEIDVVRLVRGLLERKGRIALLTVLLTALFAIPLSMVHVDTFYAETRVVMQPVRAAFEDTPLETNVFTFADTDTAIELILAEPVLEAASKALRMSPAALSEAVELSKQQRSRVILVGARGGTAERAQEIANTFTASFIDFHHGQIRLEVEAALDLLSSRVDAARAEVQKAQDALSVFVRDKGFADEAEIDGLVGRVIEGEARLNELRARLMATEQQIERTQEMMDKQSKFVSSSRTAGSRKEVRARLAEGAAMVQAGAVREGNSGALGWITPKDTGGDVRSVAPNPVRQSLELTLLDLESQGVALYVEIEQLETQLDQLRDLKLQLPEIRREYGSLMVGRDSALTELNAAIDAHRGVSNLFHLSNPIFSIVEEAKRPAEPERSRTMIALVLVFLFSLISSVSWALIAEFRDSRVRHRREVERTGVPLIATVPMRRGKGVDKKRTEAVQQVAYWVRKELRARGPYCLLVTSATAEEGKTEVLREIADVIVEWGESVLRIDANFHERSGNPGKLESYLLGHAPQPSLLQFQNGLYAITCGGPRDDAAALLASDLMDRLMVQARSTFQVSLVDGPAISPGVDAELLAEKVDGVLLVIQSRGVEQQVLFDAVARLRATGTPILGAILVDAAAKPKASPGVALVRRTAAAG
jgi:capsular polysaccharide biosynthesis protein/Mrp family chromosome partitioning ATPase